MKQELEELKPLNEIKMGVTLTPGALREFQRLRAEEKDSSKTVVRLGAKGGGCAGFSYILEFDAPRPNDHLYTFDNITIAIDPTHELYVGGTEIDFETGLNNRGFTYRNPNAQTTCGCGSSFG